MAAKFLGNDLDFFCIQTLMLYDHMVIEEPTTACMVASCYHSSWHQSMTMSRLARRKI
jgi:hypothetical protein